MSDHDNLRSLLLIVSLPTPFLTFTIIIKSQSLLLHFDVSQFKLSFIVPFIMCEAVKCECDPFNVSY